MSTGGRWRCVAYWVARARLSLAMVEQLDLAGRTGELARTFGIDFQSVLTRGSQYRVESMLVRLAHTQNYLMLSPSREQVSGTGQEAWRKVINGYWHVKFGGIGIELNLSSRLLIRPVSAHQQTCSDMAVHSSRIHVNALSAPAPCRWPASPPWRHCPL